MNTSKAYIDVNHIKPERWGTPLVDADWNAFCQALYQGIEGKDWEESMTGPVVKRSGGRQLGLRIISATTCRNCHHCGHSVRNNITNLHNMFAVTLCASVIPAMSATGSHKPTNALENFTHRNNCARPQRRG